MNYTDYKNICFWCVKETSNGNISFIFRNIESSNYRTVDICLWCIKLTFKKKILSRTLSECQMAWIQIRTDIPTFCQSWSGSKLLAKVISIRQNSPLAAKRLN